MLLERYAPQKPARAESWRIVWYDDMSIALSDAGEISDMLGSS